MTKEPNPDNLRTAFNGFIKQTLENIQAVKTIQAGLESLDDRARGKTLQMLCRSLGMEKTEFAEKFIIPWESLTQEQALEVAKFWNLTFIPQKALLMHMIPVNEHRALQWTLVNVYETNLFEVFPDELSRKPQDTIYRTFIGAECALPYQQCHYCGRLDKDPRGKAFGNRLTFCHLSGCPSDPNPTQHIAGCCYGAWKREKDNVSRRCRQLSSESDKAVAFFLSFCKKRYEENLKIQTPVRVKKDKPRGWKQPYDSLAFTVHPDGMHPPPEHPSLPLFD